MDLEELLDKSRHGDHGDAEGQMDKLYVAILEKVQMEGWQICQFIHANHGHHSCQ